LERIQAQAAAAARQREQAVPTPGPTLTPVDGMMALPPPEAARPGRSAPRARSRSPPKPAQHYIGDRSSRNAPAVDTTRTRNPKRKAEGGEEQPNRVRARTTRGEHGPRNTMGNDKPVEPRAAAIKRQSTEPSTQPDRRRPRTAGVVEGRVENIEQRLQTVPVRRRRPNQS
jgi:hypothetical protein